MNRAERRKLGKQGVSNKAIMDRTLSETYTAGYHEGMKAVSDITFYMVAYTLNYKLDFGKKRLQRIMRDIYNNIDAFRTGHLTTSDFDVIKSEMNKLGVSIEEERKKRKNEI